VEALINWLGTYGQVIAFIAQILYWVIIAVAALWAVLLFKRLVDFKTGMTVPGSGEDDTVSADEFVD
jgi:hypothetical protein